MALTFEEFCDRTKKISELRQTADEITRKQNRMRDLEEIIDEIDTAVCHIIRFKIKGALEDLGAQETDEYWNFLENTHPTEEEIRDIYESLTF